MCHHYHTLNDFYHAPALAPYLDVPAPLGAGTSRRVVALLTGLLVELGAADRYVQDDAGRAANAVAAGLASGRVQLEADLTAATRADRGRITFQECADYRLALARATTCARLADLWARLRREVERRRCLSYTTNS